MNSMIEQDNNFVIRGYGKGELAMMYMPGICRCGALKQFNRWLERNVRLTEELRATGYDSTVRLFTPKQVSLIVEYIGEP